MKNNLFYAYLAGFLDADGSIYVRLKPNSSYKYDFQISPSVVFFQKNTAEKYFKKVQEKLKIGYLRHRNDGIIEFTIGDRPSIRQVLAKILPYLIFKKKQAKLVLKILDLSEKRSIRTQMVRHHLIEKGILTP